MTAAGQINAGSRITASLIRGIAPLCAVKQADETVASSTTLQFDDALFLPVLAGAQYDFRCTLDYEGNTHGSGDIKWTWNVPTGSTLRYQATYVHNTAVSTSMLAGSATGSADTTGTGNLMGVTMDGSLFVSSTAGNLALEWAQFTSNAVGTIVHAQSRLTLWQVG